MTFDVLFVTDANASAGFGHTARCLAISKLLDTRHEIGFQGDFSPEAERRIIGAQPRAKIVAPEDTTYARVAFVDRLAHPDRLDFQDTAFFGRVAARSSRLIALSSGLLPLQVPSGARCVGYQPSDVTPNPPDLIWSFDYAPVPHGFLQVDGPEREPNRLMIALGGHPNDRPLRRILADVAMMPSVTDIDVLLSPAMLRDRTPLEVAAHQRLHVHQNVPSVAPLIQRAGAVIASYGNLVYEALALGAPVCVVGQKAFQTTLGKAMADRGCVIFGGAVEDRLPEDFLGRVTETFQRAQELSERGPQLIDGKGLARLADLIQSAWESTSRRSTDE